MGECPDTKVVMVDENKVLEIKSINFHFIMFSLIFFSKINLMLS